MSASPAEIARPGAHFGWELDAPLEYEIRSYHASLYRAFCTRLAELADAHCEHDLAARAIGCARVATKRRPTPGMARLFFTSSRGREPSSFFALARSELDAGELAALPAGFDHASRAWWAREALEDMSSDLARETGSPSEMVLLEEDAGGHAKTLSRAAQTLRAVWPEAARNAARVVTDVVWFDSDDFRSVSDRHAFGAIFIAPAPHWTDVHHLETIVHEAGHLGLLVKQGFDPLVENPTERASSPLRADRRPLSAILHAAFVLVRMAHAHARYLDHASADRKDVAARLFARRRGELAQSLDALRSHARFTARGGELFESIERGARELGARP